METQNSKLICQLADQSHNSKFKINFLFFLCLFSLFSFLFSLVPRNAEAAQERNDTAIFTGQVIPAYIGGAYDPTEGFKKLAGLPIYVFAYDSWQGTSFVIHNFAVRTQIRADGSFQAQGLPTAAHYGVYFPFFGDPGGNVTRRDNLTGNPAPQTAEFRWPVENDKIRDVFSYVVGDATATPQIVDQFGNTIRLGQAFLTNERKLDIENTINVFPLIPHRVLRVSVLAQSDFSYEVVGQRITRFAPAGQAAGLMPVLNFPVIRGRTSPSGVADNRGFVSHVFQAYAPDGFYAITVWQSGAGSETYKEWDTSSPLNAASSGFALLRVRKDWQEALADSNQVYTPRNTIMVWGVVTDEVGNIMSDLNSAAGKQDLDISIKTDTDVRYGGRRPTDQNSDFYTPGQNPLPTHTVWGIYILSQNPFADNSPLNEHFWIYIEEAGYKTNVAHPQRLIKGTDGPVRIDLTASKSEADRPSGYDIGIHLYITDPAQTVNEGRVPTAEAIIAPMQETRVKIPAVTKSYFANRLGEIHIPDSDLKYDEQYFVTVLAGNRVGFAEIMYPDPQLPAGERYAEAVIQLSKPATANAYYKILGVIPVPFMPTAYAQDEAVAIEGKIVLPEGSKITGKVPPIVYRWENSKCEPPECEVFYRDIQGNLVSATDLSQSPDHSFVLKITPPAPSEGLWEECQSQGLLPEFCPREEIALRLSTYTFKAAGSAELPTGEVMEFKGEQSITIDSAGVPTPLTLEIAIGIDCWALAGKTIEGMPLSMLPGFTQLEKIVPWGACQLGKFFIEKAPAAFGVLQRNFLQTSPVTKTGAVVNLWNIVRNVVNVLFIIFLLIIGITTILRIEPKTWSPGSLVPKLFLGIILANFSLLIVQLFIDINNVATEGIMQLALNALKGVRPASGGSEIILGSAVGTAGAVVLGSLSGWITSISIVMLSTISMPGGLAFVIALFLAILLFLLGLIMFYIFRYAVIWICAIVAPLIFAFGVLPATSKLQEIWWNALLSYTVMQTATAFVIAMGLLLLVIGGGGDSFITNFLVAFIGLLTLFMATKVPAFVASTFRTVGAKALGGPEMGRLMTAQRKAGLERKEEKAAEESEVTQLRKSGLAVPGRARRFLAGLGGGRSVELAERKGVTEGKKEGGGMFAEEVHLGAEEVGNTMGYMDISPERNTVPYRFYDAERGRFQASTFAEAAKPRSNRPGEEGRLGYTSRRAILAVNQAGMKWRGMTEEQRKVQPEGVYDAKGWTELRQRVHAFESGGSTEPTPAVTPPTPSSSRPPTPPSTPPSTHTS